MKKLIKFYKGTIAKADEINANFQVITDELDTKGQPDGYAPLDENGFVPANVLNIKTEVIDKILTDLTGKADTDLSNVTKPYVLEEVTNGTSWYRIWSNGYKEQKGVATCGSAYSGYGVQVRYAIPFENELKAGAFIYQNVKITQVGDANTVLVGARYFSTKSELHIISGQTNTPTYSWYASGY